jgi:hypothetical protein
MTRVLNPHPLIQASLNALTRVMVGLFLIVGALSHAASKDHRVALVIGAKDYQHVRGLDNTLNDARSMRDKLAKVGFDVVYEENPTRDGFLKAINRFEDRLRKDSVALVYFAGHGAEVRGENFLIPVDARGRRRDDIEHEAIRLQFLLNKFSNIGSELNLVILDACRDDPFPSAGRSGAGGLTEVKNAPKGTLIAYAAAPGQKAIDGIGDGSNGVYTAALLKNLDQPGKKIEEVFKDVRAEVVRSTNNQQTPWENSSLVGDFYFVPRQQVAIAVIPPPAPVDRSVDLELTFWNSIKDSTTLSDFEAYLEQFPKGTFAPLARSRVNALKRAAEAVKPKPEPTTQASTPPIAPTTTSPSPPQVASIPVTPTKPDLVPASPASQPKPQDTKPLGVASEESKQAVVKADAAKPIGAPPLTAYTDRAALNGKSFFGSSAGGNRWLMQMTVKGERISVESMWLEMGAERFQMNCGGLFSPGLAIAADLTVSGNCTGGNTTRTVTGRFPDLAVSDTATSSYDARWPATTASGASIRMIDEASRQAYLGGSLAGRLSTKEWSESQRR